jgi:outer membrane protein TolC
MQTIAISSFLGEYQPDRLSRIHPADRRTGSQSLIHLIANSRILYTCAIMSASRICSSLRSSASLRRCGQAVLAVLLCTSAFAQKLTLQRAVELGMANGPAVGMATADVTHAQKGYDEARNAYIPQLVVGSGLGKSFGFPMSIEGSAPSVFQVNVQSFIYNPAQSQFLRAARSEITAANFSAQDQRNQVATETALTYVQLVRTLDKINVLTTLVEQAERSENILKQRLQEGVAALLDVKRASLTLARSRLRLADSTSAADLLRIRLSQLTGLPLAEISPDPASIPQLPEVLDTDVSRAVQNSPAIRAAEQKVIAKQQRAEGEHRQNYPAIDLAGSYGLFSRFNNYDEFFNKFQRNNATLGVSIRFPFLNYPQRAHAAAADAETTRARKEADAARQQILTDSIKMKNAVAQAAAARDVAQLEYELSQTDVDAAQARIQTGQATIVDEQNARIGVADKQAALIDANFDFERARLQFLSATGDLNQWAGVK